MLARRWRCLIRSRHAICGDTVTGHTHMGRLLDLFSARFIQLLEAIMVLMMLGMLILVGLTHQSLI